MLLQVVSRLLVQRGKVAIDVDGRVSGDGWKLADVLVLGGADEMMDGSWVGMVGAVDGREERVRGMSGSEGLAEFASRATDSHRGKGSDFFG